MGDKTWRRRNSMTLRLNGIMGQQQPAIKRPFAPTRQADIMQNAPFMLRRRDPFSDDEIEPLPPLPVNPNQVPLMMNRSGAIATGLVSQLIAPESFDRVLLAIQNPSTATEPLYYDFGTQASIEQSSLVLAPGQGVILDFQCPIQDLWVNATTTGHLYFVKEGIRPFSGTQLAPA